MSLFAVYPRPLNAALAAKSFQRQMKGKGASLAEGADALIVAAPGKSNLQAIILILDPQAMSDRFPAIRQRQRVLALVGQVDDGRSEDRPIMAEQDPAG